MFEIVVTVFDTVVVVTDTDTVMLDTAVWDTAVLDTDTVVFDTVFATMLEMPAVVVAEDQMLGCIPLVAEGKPPLLLEMDLERLFLIKFLTLEMTNRPHIELDSSRLVS
ncbi:hypothetical protein LXL04_030618 [Taraxacum kok-saghyz]